MLGLLACNKQEQTDNGENEASLKRDSMALYVAVFPCEGSLPLYYAEASGMFDSAKMDVKLLHLNTMEDCDTALIHRHAEISVSDMARLICMRKDSFEAAAIAQLPGSMALYTAKSARLNEVKQLKERIVAIDRHSEADYYSDKVLENTSLERLDIFRTQFNNHKLREEMLSNKLIDAAFLDEPYGTLAIEHGAKRIWQRSDDASSWNVLAMASSTFKDTRRVEQASKLIAIYQKAAEAMKDSTQQVVTSVLKEQYGIPNIEVDTMPSLRQSIKPQPLRPAIQNLADQAKSWLTSRGWIDSGIKTNDLVHNLVK